MNISQQITSFSVLDHKILYFKIGGRSFSAIYNREREREREREKERFFQINHQKREDTQVMEKNRNKQMKIIYGKLKRVMGFKREKYHSILYI